MELLGIAQQQIALRQTFQQDGDAVDAFSMLLIMVDTGSDLSFPLAIAATADERQRHGSLQIIRRVWRI